MTPDTASAIFSRLDPAKIALLFDVDGTLIDIGPSPFEVDVSDELKESLSRLYERTQGALALVSGRPIRDLDLLFAPLRLPAVGGHGAETRLSEGAPVSRIEDLPEGLRRHLIEAAVPGSGIVYEDKGYSVALHYRKAPQEAERLRRHIAAGRAAFPDERTEVLLGKAMFEVKRPGVNKGDAVRRLMTEGQFVGRAPIFLGDDVTDESVFDILPELGGKGFGVGRHFPQTAGIFPSPADVRQALHLLARDAQPSVRLGTAS
ncbi:trehalose-phosphatase [Pseudolabrys taiwanensis]|uniref:trehalose-phosphatase n=1 Tax=Pseudolabrys taiwanensis TaxID=331696 RepID=UPI0013B44BE8|nr:trehalose-phosphatase [Pseudolabrys taiwanensis]